MGHADIDWYRDDNWGTCQGQRAGGGYVVCRDSRGVAESKIRPRSRDQSNPIGAINIWNSSTSYRERMSRIVESGGNRAAGRITTDNQGVGCANNLQAEQGKNREQRRTELSDHGQGGDLAERSRGPAAPAFIPRDVWKLQVIAALLRLILGGIEDGLQWLQVVSMTETPTQTERAIPEW